MEPERTAEQGSPERLHLMHRLAQFAARVGSASPVSAEPLERAAAELFQAFAEAQVEALLLKGPALARLLY